MKPSINIFFDDTEILDLDPEFFVSWLSNVCLKEGFVLEELNFIFCSDDILLGINNEFLSHDYYTDVITFNNNVGTNIIGEIYISLDRVIENAKELKSDFNDELRRVVVHGVLHLCGFNDQTLLEIELMRKKENEYLLYVSRET